jgi:hypothetical protein
LREADFNWKFIQLDTQIKPASHLIQKIESVKRGVYLDPLVARSGGWKSRAQEIDRKRRVVASRRAVEGEVLGDASRSTGC